MIILLFILTLALSTTITNKITSTSDESTESYEFSKSESKTIAFLFLFMFVLEFIFKRVFTDYYIFIAFIVNILALILLLIIAQYRKIRLERIKDDIYLVYDILQPLIDKKGSKETYDFSKADYRLSYNKNQIDKITLKVNFNGFNEEEAILCIHSLNKFLNHYVWILETKYEDREVYFVGTPLPPKLAKYKGSWLRPSGFIPYGVGGKGEAGNYIYDIKDENMGRSLYIRDDGNVLDLIKSPSAPQSLIVGSTGSGKAIYINQEIDL